jgi:cation transport regulator
MPYKNVTELPESIKKLPMGAQKIFMSVFNTSMYKGDYGEDMAFKIAWAAVKKRFKKLDNKWVAKGLGHSFYRFELNKTDKLFIQKGNDGEYYLEGVLSDSNVDTMGYKFLPETLKSFANQINDRGIFGGITHEEWDGLKLKYSHLSEDEFVKKALSERKGVLKVIKAIYEKGKLWIKALVDKRYLNHVQKFKSMSIEALIPKQYQKGKMYTGGTILGLALDNSPVNPRAVVTKIAS